MENHRRIDVTLRLDIDAEPITGDLRQGQTPAQPFYGWLQLAAALDQALDAGRQAPGAVTRAKDT